MNRPYEIVTTHKDRKILVVKQPFNPEATEELKRDDFDIIFIDTPEVSYPEFRYFMAWFSPLTSKKCQLKPLFLTSLFNEDPEKLLPLFDGFALSPLDESVQNRSEEILEFIEHSDMMPMEGEILSEMDMFVRLTQRCVTRGIFELTSSSLPSCRKGLSAIYAACIELQDYKGLPTHPNDTYLREYIESLREQGFVQQGKFLHRIHLCPICKGDHLLFSESCTKCESSHLSEEDMIHHFRCANIAPESEYMYDGRLRCPKCKRTLRHIGIDYDRPAKVSVCFDCGATIMRPAMKVSCAECQNVTVPRLLIPHDIYEYTLTPKGKQAALDYVI